MDAIVALKTRRSVRSYLARPVPREIIEDVVDCGRLAASANNAQPWEFVAVTDGELRRKLANLADFGRFIADAPVCIVVLCRDSKYYLEDGCAATENLLLAARAHELGSCWVAGDKKPYAREICGLLGAPEGYRLISMVAMGYPAETGGKEKRALPDVLHWDRYSSRAPADR
ncbi:MAG: nitroreductase family protein [Bryobacterales bacterium]|jgi:nitroreductase|nr:nitroreductase family protein [Bryobacterales bacterium]